jgi:hypothetical protein
MIHGRQNIQTFWKKASEGLGDGRFEVTDVEALGPMPHGNKVMPGLKPRALNPRRSTASMWWCGKRSMGSGSLILISGT